MVVVVMVPAVAFRLRLRHRVTSNPGCSGRARNARSGWHGRCNRRKKLPGSESGSAQCRSAHGFRQRWTSTDEAVTYSKLRRVIQAAKRSVVKPRGMARPYPTKLESAMRPELIGFQLYGGATMKMGNVYE